MLSDEDVAAAYDYAEGYKKFLDNGKTEREFVKGAVTLLEKEGFVPYAFGMKAVPGGNIITTIAARAFPLLSLERSR